MIRGICVAVLLSFAAALAQPPAQVSAQPPTTAAPPHPLAFDVVTIKRARASFAPPSIQSPPDGDTIVLANMSPRRMIGFAYDLGLHDMVFGLPGWADSETYDIVAKVAESDLPAFRALLPRQRNPMLQLLLAARFHLKAHYEPKVIPAYAIVVAKGGSKLVAAEPAAGESGGIRMARGRIAGDAAPIAPLLDALAQQLGRPVVDRTGLTGHYNFTLQFAPAQAPADAQPEAQPDAGPSIFTAVEDQLGLKLEPAKAPIPILVVDHIERPTED